MNRVRVKSVYTFQPVGIDKFDPRSDAKPGDQVRVINLRGAPKANTMGHCHIESLDGEFLGMVHVNSLVRDNPKRKPWQSSRRCRRITPMAFHGISH
jgi:hypothetical protein